MEPTVVNSLPQLFSHFRAFSYRGQRLTVQEGTSAKTGLRLAEIVIEPVNHFTAEMDHFSTCILEDKKTPNAR